MTQHNVKEDGVPAAPSPLTLAELLQVLSLGGRITLTVGDSPATTLFTALPGEGLAPLLDTPIGTSHCEPAPSSVAPPSADGGDFLALSHSSASISAGGISCALPAAIPGPSRKRDTPASPSSEIPPTSPEQPVLAQDGKPEAVEVSSDEEDKQDDDVGPWYTITRGRRVGVFSGWDTVSPLVVGVSGACYNRKASRAQAKMVFARAVRDGNVSIIR
ncbi:hypothetical protein D9615_006532 [Tricholomella constricta]|uniref:Ribonuclease H1 N-terminal domain-containing protein n=1 Tax=Tricholomella constricta TaxID=117010 RepID=A0A8H5HA38_9AGAR|nr:hypothetical protein D9615_006532 [Tricholomella constricta]